MNLKRRLDKIFKRVKPDVWIFVIHSDGENSFEYEGREYNLTDEELNQFKSAHGVLVWHEEHTEEPVL